MRLNNRIILHWFLFSSILFVSCERESTPCECGQNLSKPFGEIDQDLEAKCEEYVLKLSKDQRKIWNKQVLDCTSEK
jgi:hypothetical protein